MKKKLSISRRSKPVWFLQPAISGSKEKSGCNSTYLSANELKGKFFPVSDTKMMQKFKSDMDALKYGIKSEKSSTEFLSSLLEKEKKLDVKAVFSHLMVRGKKHLALLKDLKKKFNSGAGMIAKITPAPWCCEVCRKCQAESLVSH